MPAGKITGQQRKLARNAQLRLSAPDVAETAARTKQVAAAAGGYTGKARIGDESAMLKLHVPSDRLDPVLVELAALGQVLDREQEVRDVTATVIDVEARLKSQQASVQRVRELLERAESLSEVVSIERELTSRQAELESLQARHQQLADKVAMSTVTVRVSAQAGAAEDDAGILGGLGAGWDAFVAFCATVLTALAAALPFLLLLAVPGVALIWYRRRRARHA